MALGVIPSPSRKKVPELKNRLILIGNGFDLAHGLKTRFEDFYLDYLTTAINKFYALNEYEDELLGIKFVNEQHVFTQSKKITVKPHEAMKKLSEWRKNSQLRVKFKSSILRTIDESISEKKWVNIEALYFDVLLEIMKNNPEKNWSSAVRELNKELEFIEKLLVAYLLEIENDFSFDDSYINPLVNLFAEDFLIQDFATLNLTNNRKPTNILFLNFNYTDILSHYLESCRLLANTDITYIHGRIKDIEQNPIIFGFGDEHNKKYLDFEDKNNNILFEHIKSFKYLRADNYYNLLRFIDANLFQVHIYGHSCGVTDRTMLNHIFEHDNCKSIKIFYHEREDGTNDYIDKTYEISRHFNNKGLMRKKVVPFPQSKAMPQAKQKLDE